MDVDSEPEILDPIDFMTYTEQLVDFLGGEEIEERYLEIWRERHCFPNRGHSGYPSPGPTLGSGDDDPLVLRIYNARESFDRYFQTGELGLEDAVLDTTALGRAISTLRDCDVITPSGEAIKKSFEDIYRKRIRLEENFWDAIFELEIAAALSRTGFNVKLIEEQEMGGPDIFVQTADGPVWFECKRKRKQTAIEASYQQLRLETIQRFWN